MTVEVYAQEEQVAVNVPSMISAEEAELVTELANQALANSQNAVNTANNAVTAAGNAQNTADNHAKNTNNPHGVTAAQVGARPDTWMPSASDVGAAPDGYGLGGNAVYATSADDINANGYYETAIDFGSGMESCIVWHNQHSSNYAEQKCIIILGFSPGSILHRVKISGEWQPWGWVNPPMKEGKEYRTTEQWKGKPVYTKMVELGTAVNGEIKRYGISNIDEMLRAYGRAGENPLPYEDHTGAYCKLALATNACYVHCSDGFVGQAITATLFYTKST